MSSTGSDGRSAVRKDSNESNDNDDEPVRKSKGFKRIRGLLSSGKKKKSTKNDDNESTFSVTAEDRSVATNHNINIKMNAASDNNQQDQNTANSIRKIVLVLMDPASRRFELLQLEFDSTKALVSDVMAQIPISLTEHVLRQKTYVALAAHTGKPVPADALLSDCCADNEVLVGVPQGTPAKECVRLARPIVTDKGITAMVRDC
jgi:hypothetical protein